MTLKKTSENYTIEDSLENGWKVNGSLTKSSDNISLDINVFDDEAHENIGYYNWNKTNSASSNYNVNKAADEAAFIAAVNAVKESVLESI